MQKNTNKKSLQNNCGVNEESFHSKEKYELKTNNEHKQNLAKKCLQYFFLNKHRRVVCHFIKKKETKRGDKKFSTPNTRPVRTNLDKAKKPPFTRN
jgi:hypothetical protein